MEGGGGGGKYWQIRRQGGRLERALGGEGMNGGGGRAVSQAHRICGEFRLVTIASIPWMLMAVFT